MKEQTDSEDRDSNSNNPGVSSPPRERVNLDRFPYASSRRGKREDNTPFQPD